MKNIFYFLTIILLLISFAFFSFSINKYINIKYKYEQLTEEEKKLDNQITEKTNNNESLKLNYENIKNNYDSSKVEVYEKWKKDREEIEKYLLY